MSEPHFMFQALAPVRASASDKAEMVTQLVFGDVVEVLERDHPWLRVRIAVDGYEGWIDEKAVLPVDQSWLDAILGWEYVMADSLAVAGTWAGTSLPLHLSLGARVPRTPPRTPPSTPPRTPPRTPPVENGALHIAIGKWQLEIASGDLRPALEPTAEALVAVSERFLGAPYLWGGKSLWGIDCSGFTQMVYSLCGCALPRDASQQVALGTEVAFEDRTAGDLAFFVNKSGNIHHVGLVLPDGNVRHASGHVHDSLLVSEGIIGKYTGKQTHTLCNIKRIV